MSITRALDWCQAHNATIECKDNKFHVYTHGRPTIITDSIEDAVTYYQLRDARIQQIGLLAYIVEQDEKQQQIHKEKKENVNVIYTPNPSASH